MPEFDWGKYETQEPGFNWEQYENPEPKKATESDKLAAFNAIKQKHPGMPDFLIHALMPAATKMAETPKNTDKGTATGAFLRSAIRTPLEGAENLASLVGLPVNRQAKFPESIQESESDKSHPFAQLGGSLVGFLAPGAGSVAALRSLPGWGAIAAESAPSFLRRLPVMASEGAALGAGFSEPGQRGIGALTGGALGAAGSAIPSVARGVMNLKNRITSLRQLDKLREEGIITDDQYQKALHDEDALKELSKSQGLGTNVTEMEAELPNARQEAEQLQQDIQNIPEVNTENMLGAPTGEELVPHASKMLEGEQQRAAKAEEALASDLYKGKEHGVPIAESVVSHIKTVKKDIGKEYDAAKNILKNEKVDIPLSESIEDVYTNARESLNKYRDYFKDDEAFEKQVDNLAKSTPLRSKGVKTIPAQEILSNYQTLRHLSQETRNKAYSKGTASNKDLQGELLKNADLLEQQAHKLETLLESHDLGKATDILKGANKRWRTEVIPVSKNQTYQTFLNKGYASNENIIKSLRGNGAGQEIIREIIKSDPELIKHALGQRFAKEPGKIHEFDELVQEYLNVAPKETRNLINVHKQSLENVKNAESKHTEAKIKAEHVKEESERVKKSFEEEKKTQKERKEKKEKLKELKTKIENYERNIPALKKKAASKDISLKQKIELENTIKKSEKDVESLKKQAQRIAIGIGIVGAGALGFNLKHPLG